jgi:hypothetical protein
MHCLTLWGSPAHRCGEGGLFSVGMMRDGRMGVGEGPQCLAGVAGPICLVQIQGQQAFDVQPPTPWRPSTCLVL